MQDTQSISSSLVSLRASEAPASRAAQARDVAAQFEAIFVQQMVAAMRTSASGGEDGGMFGSGAGSDTYASWFDTSMAEHIGKRGGVGLAPIIERNILAHVSPDNGNG